MTAERWQQVKRVFQSAMELAPVDRAAYVEAETAGDTDLRAEVDKMLRHASGAGLLDQPAWKGIRMEPPLGAGSRLGPYEILAELGAGGMGTVYQARDTRLERIVAIKVLNAEFSHRVRTEGRAISALNHPHVCALYDIGDQDGAAYLVMEYVEGESLAACLARGPLSLGETLRYGSEIASALAAAHARGIVHRDLKPANIMITASGAKVLDFGVARVGQDEEASSGALVGTTAYMSPSQLNGNPADPRSDIYALGLVLWEMATGVRHSVGSSTMPAHVPAALAGLIERCLRKDAAGRFQCMDDVRQELERLRSESPRGRRWLISGAAAAMLAIAAMVAWNFAPPKPRPAPESAPVNSPVVQTPPISSSPVPAARTPVVRHAAYVPPSLATLTAYRGIERDPSFSPDGTQVAFSWHSGNRGGYGIYVRPVAEGEEPVCLTDEGAEDWGPAWSPDGRRIAFRRRGAQSGIYWVKASGGPAHLVGEIGRQDQETLPQISWSRDGKWIAAPDRDFTGATHLYLFAVDSGDRSQITFNAKGTDHAPVFSPDGKSLAYASCAAGVSRCDVYVLALDRAGLPQERKRITEESVYIRGVAWLPDGKSLVYSAGSTAGRDTYLWRVAVNPPGVPERIDMAGSQARHPAISMHGSLLAYTRLNNWRLMMIRNFR